MRYMEIHVYSTLHVAYVQVEREEGQPTKIMNMHVTCTPTTKLPTYVLEDSRIPSHENWDGGLKSLANSPHTSKYPQTVYKQNKT